MIVLLSGVAASRRRGWPERLDRDHRRGERQRTDTCDRLAANAISELRTLLATSRASTDDVFSLFRSLSLRVVSDSAADRTMLGLPRLLG
jgi:hypothetical protein